MIQEFSTTEYEVRQYTLIGELLKKPEYRPVGAKPPPGIEILVREHPELTPPEVTHRVRYLIVKPTGLTKQKWSTPREILSIKKESWDQGVKLRVQKRYDVWGEVRGEAEKREQILEYQRLIPARSVKHFEDLLGALKATLQAQPTALRRNLMESEIIHAAFFALGQSFTPSLISAFTGIPRDKVAYELYKVTGPFTAIPDVYLPHILAESQYYPKRFVDPQYHVDEILGKAIPREAAHDFKIEQIYWKLTKDYVSLDDWLIPKPPVTMPPPTLALPPAPPPLPLEATKAPYMVYFKDNVMHISWTMPSKWMNKKTGKKFVSWYPPVDPQDPQATYPLNIEFLNVATEKDLLMYGWKIPPQPIVEALMYQYKLKKPEITV